MKKLIAIIALSAFTLNAFANPQCKGLTLKGIQCKRIANKSGYCSIHDPAAPHCKALTKKGAPCKNLPMHGSSFCRVHGK